MQLLQNRRIPVVVTVAACLLLAANICEIKAAPQGNVLTHEIQESKHVTEHKVEEKNNHELNSHLEHHPQIVEAANKAETLALEDKKGNCGDTVKEDQLKHHIQIREAVEDATGRSDRVEKSNNCIEVGKQIENLQHKITVRQTEQSGTQGESGIGSDDLVASLIRQRDDFIAAAAVPVAPLPVQNIRMNLNSGL